MRRYVPSAPENHLPDEELKSVSPPSSTKNPPPVVVPRQKGLDRECEQEPGVIAATSTPAASNDDASGRIARSDCLPVAAQRRGYHREPTGTSNAMLSELLHRQDLMQSSRRRLAPMNSSTNPTVSDSLYPQSFPAAASLLSSPIYAGLRGAPSFFAPPNTLYSGGTGELSVSIPQYAPSNRDPRLSQMSVPARDLYNPLLIQQLPYATNLYSSLLGGAVDPCRHNLQDIMHRTQQGRLARVPIHLPGTTTGLQNEFVNPDLAQLHVQPGSMNAYPLLVAAQQRSALLSAAYLPPPPAQLPQEDIVSDTLMSLGQRVKSSYVGSLSAVVSGGGPESFPMVLYRALIDLELTEDGTDIASFLPGGKAFLIRDHFLLEEQVLPVFFPKMKSFASFQRQLNLYDFKRVGGAGVDRDAYRHALFARGSPDNVSRMKRTKIKGGPPRGPPRRNIDRTHRDGDDGTGNEKGRQIQEAPA